MTLQGRIERSFYEVIRKRVLRDGYTPDIEAYDDTPEGFRLYEQDLKTILDTKEFAVEVYGMSNPEAKGYKKLARIVFITDSFVPGEFGIENRIYMVRKAQGGFTPEQPTQTISHQLFMQCHIVCNDTSQLRYLVDVINSTLPLRGYLPWYDYKMESFFVESSSFIDVSSSIDGIIEKIYGYRVPDIVWTEPVVDAEMDPVVPIRHINLHIQKKLGLLTSDSEYWIPDPVAVPRGALATKSGIFIQTNKDQLILVNN